MVLKIKKSGDTFHLSGNLDEMADLSFLKSLQAVKLNVAEVELINSLGTKMFIDFVGKIGANNIELYDLSFPFVDLVNTYPAMLGKPYNPHIVKSVYVPFECSQCEYEARALIQITTPEKIVEKLTRFQCKNCRGAMELAGEFDDFFLFLEEGY